MNDANEIRIDEVIEEFGEVKVLERVALQFDFMYQDGIVRPPEKLEAIRKYLKFIEERMTSDLI